MWKSSLPGLLQECALLFETRFSCSRRAADGRVRAAMNVPAQIERIADLEPLLPAFAALLQDAVQDGASSGFLRPLPAAAAENFWREIAREVSQNSRVLLIAKCEGELAGTVQLGLCGKPNGLHRAEVQKLLVHTRWRGRGIGKALMSAIELEARALGRALLYLDTEPGKPAESLYQRHGWTRCGEIPDYACTPDGHLHPTALYFRRL